MKEYTMLMGLLSVIYIGYLMIEAKERKMLKRYYGYRSRRSSSSAKHVKQLRRAA